MVWIDAILYKLCVMELIPHCGLTELVRAQRMGFKTNFDGIWNYSNIIWLCNNVCLLNLLNTANLEHCIASDTYRMFL